MEPGAIGGERDENGKLMRRLDGGEMRLRLHRFGIGQLSVLLVGS